MERRDGRGGWVWLQTGLTVGRGGGGDGGGGRMYVGSGCRLATTSVSVLPKTTTAAYQLRGRRMKGDERREEGKRAIDCQEVLASRPVIKQIELRKERANEEAGLGQVARLVSTPNTFQV